MLRKIGIFLTIALVLLCMLGLAYFQLLENQHAAVDSEVGVVLSALYRVIVFEFTIVGLFFSSFIWGKGIEKDSGRIAIKRPEVVVQKSLYYASMVLTVLVILMLIAGFITSWFIY